MGGSAGNIAFVLVEPREPGNIGSAARAMVNMGLGRLVLVRPVPFLVPQAYRMAMDGAEVLRRAEVHEDLAEAVRDCALVVGTTRRERSVGRETGAPRRLAPELLRTAGNHRSAVLFGREDSGLTNEDVQLCHRIMTIPTSSRSPSLNLSQAVLVVAYEIFLAERDAEDGDRRQERSLAPSSELEGMYAHMEDALRTIDYLDKQNPKRMMRVFRDIFSRAGLDQREVSAWRGIFRQVKWSAGNSGERTNREKRGATTL
jgi:TrmH family RNA methyltransferase